MRPSAHCRLALLGLLVGALFSAALAAAQQSSLTARVDVTRNGHRQKDASAAVVWLTPVGIAFDPPAQSPDQIPKLTQKHKSFQPSLVVIPVGGKVEFPNHDPFFHNVFSLFEGKRFDLGLYEGGTTRFVQFDEPGISYIFCNIHAQMSAVVIALNTPYYAISNSRGDLSLGNVPAGRYELQVFHPSVAPDALHALHREITVTPENTFLGTFTLAESDLLLAHKNKYNRDYDRPEPESPAYAHP